MNPEIHAVQSPGSGSVPKVRAYRHPVLVWTIAWGITGVALYSSGVFNTPRTGPLWIALAGGMISWAIAGLATFPVESHGSSPRWNITISIIWALAYLVSFALAGFLINWFPIRNTITGIFVAAAGWSVGAGFGAFISTWLASVHPKVMRSVIIAGIWMLGFFTGCIVVYAVGFYGAELAKIFIGFLVGVQAALILGFGSGAALGGFVASAIAVRATHAVNRFF
jgi:hypothetical protein